MGQTGKQERAENRENAPAPVRGGSIGPKQGAETRGLDPPKTAPLRPLAARVVAGKTGAAREANPSRDLPR